MPTQRALCQTEPASPQFAGWINTELRTLGATRDVLGEPSRTAPGMATSPSSRSDPERAVMGTESSEPAGAG